MRLLRMKPGSITPVSPIPVKRGRGRPRKSVNKSESPKITSFFKSSITKALLLSENNSSDASATEKSERKRSLLTDVNQIPSPGARTPVRGVFSPGSRRTLGVRDKENLGDGEDHHDHLHDGDDSTPGGLLKFVDSSGQDITMKVRVSLTPEKRTDRKENVADPDENEDQKEAVEDHDVEADFDPLTLDPHIDADFDAAFNKLKNNVPSVMQISSYDSVKKSFPNVSVETSPSLSMDEVLKRLKLESIKNKEDEACADDEDDGEMEDMEDIATTSSAWSSITTLMMGSPLPGIVVSSPAKERSTNDPSDVSMITGLPMRARKRSPKKEKRYQRSQRMSRLIDDDITDTDDGEETTIQGKPLVTATKVNDDSDFEISFSNGQSQTQYKVIDHSNNVAPQKDDEAEKKDTIEVDKKADIICVSSASDDGGEILPQEEKEKDQENAGTGPVNVEGR